MGRGEARFQRPRRTTPTTPEEGEEGEAPGKDVTIEEGVGNVSLTFRALIEMEGPAGLPVHLVVWEQVLAVSREWFARAAAATDEKVDGGDCSEDRSILWFGTDRDCGVRARVKSLNAETPVLMSVEEQPAVSYQMEYDGESVVSAVCVVELTFIALIMRSMLPLIAMDRTFLETLAVDESALAVVPIG